MPVNGRFRVVGGFNGGVVGTLGSRAIVRRVLPAGEANGVWWLPRSSKPLFRRGSVEGLVRFRPASAIITADAVLPRLLCLRYRRGGGELPQRRHPSLSTRRVPRLPG